MGITLSAAIVWLIIAVIFGVIEAFTVGIATIWFAAGALAAAIAAMAGAGLPVQIVLFFAVSIILLYFTRPLVKKKLKVGSEKTNTDALIGKEAVVTSDIPELGTGQVKINGLDWTAVGADPHTCITAGTTVIIEGIEGVKLIVSRV